jgi:hypothetical protein
MHHHKLGSLKQFKFILLQFWVTEIPNQGVGRAVLPRKALKENLFLPFLFSWLGIP